MLFVFDKKSLLYKNVTKEIVMVITGAIFLTMLFMGAFMVYSANDVELISEETRTIIVKESEKRKEFSSDKLREYILELNLKFPHIVYAQARLETGNFNSFIFKKNSNLFGMKVAKYRPTTNKGEANGHACYETWQASVVDYGFWQAKYMSGLSNEKEYLDALSQIYAEDTQYIKLLNVILDEETIVWDEKFTIKRK